MSLRPSSASYMFDCIMAMQRAGHDRSYIEAYLLDSLRNAYDLGRQDVASELRSLLYLNKR